jgi:hypothetical protein
MIAYWCVLLTKYYSGDQIKNNYLGFECSTNGGRGEVRTGFWWRNLRESVYLEGQVQMGGQY